MSDDDLKAQDRLETIMEEMTQLCRKWNLSKGIFVGFDDDAQRHVILAPLPSPGTLDDMMEIYASLIDASEEVREGIKKEFADLTQKYTSKTLN